jgi:HPt (histidine-containing phosphotransfer) domain-containing protein
MSPLKLLLIESDANRAAKLLDDLATDSLDVFHVCDSNDAAEALRLKNFDVILLGSADAASSLSAEVAGSPRAPLIVGIGLPPDSPGISASVSATEARDLPAQLFSLQEARLCEFQEGDSGLVAFDLGAFREQMGQDEDLIKEIISLFRTESSAQVRDLAIALRAEDFPRVSRLAHSLKGSLGSLYALRARYWAAALETNAAAVNAGRSEQCFAALQSELLELERHLRSTVPEQTGDSPALLH